MFRSRAIKIIAIVTFIAFIVLCVTMAFTTILRPGHSAIHATRIAIETGNMDDGVIPDSYRIANPCSPGVPSVYQTPDGMLVVRNGENNNKWTEIVQTPQEFCDSFKGS